MWQLFLPLLLLWELKHGYPKFYFHIELQRLFFLLQNENNSEHQHMEIDAAGHRHADAADPHHARLLRAQRRAAAHARSPATRHRAPR